MPRVSVTETHLVNRKSELNTPLPKVTKTGEKSSILSAPLSRREPLQERVRARIRNLVTTREVGHAVLGKYLGLTRSVTRLLNDEGQGIALQHIERVCDFFQVTASELMAESGALIQAITPTEASLLAYFRQLTEVQRMGLLAILDRSAQQPATQRRAKLGRTELTDEQQLLVDLYARSNEQARSGILKTLRGTAQSGDVERATRRTTE